ncbi:MAG: response regulator [Bacteroidetes bacterium HGW-Bacteroidetes-12]|nr:MAG: response regulator [Bacteroidetes bacterium HGW-Bacteroidetes-12]
MSIEKEKFEGKTILVVEDDTTNRTLLKEILKNKGIDIQFAKTGEEALIFFENNKIPNLVLMDIRLPDISGIDLTKQILTKYPDALIVAQTAFATPDVEEECYSIGMKAFITKPLNTQIIERILDKLAW